MPRFYVNVPLNPGQEIQLPDDVVRHIHVIRLRAQDQVVLFNGDGNEYPATVIEINKKSILARINNIVTNIFKQKITINLLLCVIANDKMDIAIQKAVELGVTTITPILSERSQPLNHERAIKRLEHWKKIIISSAEQCGNNILPNLENPIHLKNIALQNPDGVKLVLCPEIPEVASNKESPIDSNLLSIHLLVGPEGGLSQQEINWVTQNNFVPVQLGNLVLRTETAVIAGLSYVQLKYGNWSFTKS